MNGFAGLGVECCCRRFSLSLPLLGALLMEVFWCRYQNYNAEEKHKLAMEIHKIIVTRPRGWTNFIDFHDDKVVYRRYAGLYFCLCVDRSANELATLELIHLYVEACDKFFGSVCELDLVFNFFNCVQLWDELVLGGEPVETSRKVLLERMNVLKEKMDADGGKMPQQLRGLTKAFDKVK